jgi:hypothetical protein
MEPRVLVKRDGVRRVLMAEDVTATTAMVAALEEGEDLVAHGAVARHGCRIGLYAAVSNGLAPPKTGIFIQKWTTNQNRDRVMLHVTWGRLHKCGGDRIKALEGIGFPCFRARPATRRGEEPRTLKPPIAPFSKLSSDERHEPR